MLILQMAIPPTTQFYNCETIAVFVIHLPLATEPLKLANYREKLTRYIKVNPNSIRVTFQIDPQVTYGSTMCCHHEICISKVLASSGLAKITPPLLYSTPPTTD